VLVIEINPFNEYVGAGTSGAMFDVRPPLVPCQPRILPAGAPHGGTMHHAHSRTLVHTCHSSRPTSRFSPAALRSSSASRLRPSTIRHC